MQCDIFGGLKALSKEKTERHRKKRRETGCRNSRKTFSRMLSKYSQHDFTVIILFALVLLFLIFLITFYSYCASCVCSASNIEREKTKRTD